MIQPVVCGLIGPGGFGQHRLKAAAGNPMLTIEAIFPTEPDFYAGYACYDHLSDFLTHPGLEAVIVSAPNPQHVQLALAAFEAGKHVFIEKPLANSVREGAAILRAARARHLTLAVGHNSRRAAHARAMRRFLDDRTLGRIVLAEGHFSHNGGLTLQPESWRWSPETCPGGPLNLLAIHEIDTLQYLLGPVARVNGWQRKLATPAAIPDTTLTFLELESGTLAYVGANYVSPWARALRLFGTGGSARWDEGGGLLLDTPEIGSRSVPLTSVDTLREELEDFAVAIRANRLPEVDGLTGLLNVAVMEAALESNRRGEAVAVREILQCGGALDLLYPS